jgi:hypothetical protein
VQILTQQDKWQIREARPDFSPHFYRGYYSTISRRAGYEKRRQVGEYKSTNTDAAAGTTVQILTQQLVQMNGGDYLLYYVLYYVLYYRCTRCTTSSTLR